MWKKLEKIFQFLVINTKLLITCYLEYFYYFYYILLIFK